MLLDRDTAPPGLSRARGLWVWLCAGRSSSSPFFVGVLLFPPSLVQVLVRWLADPRSDQSL